MESRTEAARSFLVALLHVHVAWTLAFASDFETPALTLPPCISVFGDVLPCTAVD